MDEWTPSEKWPGYVCRTIKHGNATIIVHRPILAPEEKAKREKQVKRDLEIALRDYFFRTEQEGAKV